MDMLTVPVLTQATADLYNQLGLPEYEAMEAFVEYNPHKASHLFKTATAGLQSL
jgi:tRNA(Leu) C34 or U34 (ribose-2'-O)-methylase TrmL